MATNDYTEIGATGLDQWQGVINADFLRELRGKEGYRRYREMSLNSPVIGALLYAVEQACRTAQWGWTSDQGEDDPRLELLNDAINGMTHSWNDHLSEALTMLSFGYAYFEIVYRRDDRGRVMWQKFGVRGQDTIERWAIDDRGGINGAYQRAAPKYAETYLPIEKCLLYRTRVDRNNPEGRSILRTAWISYYYLKNIQQIEAIGIERDLAGLPVIGLPETADTTDSVTSDAGKAKKIVRNVRRDEQEGIVLPFGWAFNLVSTGGARQFDTDKIISRYEQRILMSCLAQFLMLGTETGSYALSSDQTDFFNMATNHTADIIAAVMTKYAAPRLLALNGYDTAGISWTHSPVGDIDLRQLGDFLQKVGNMITWTAQDEAWLRGAAKLPELATEEIEEERSERQRRALEIAAVRRPVSAAPEPDETDETDEQQLTASALTLGDLVSEIQMLRAVSHV